MRFIKSLCLVLIGLVFTEIEAFNNVKHLQRKIKCIEIRTNQDFLRFEMPVSQ